MGKNPFPHDWLHFSSIRSSFCKFLSFFMFPSPFPCFMIQRPSSNTFLIDLWPRKVWILKKGRNSDKITELLQRPSFPSCSEILSPLNAASLPSGLHSQTHLMGKFNNRFNLCNSIKVNKFQFAYCLLAICGYCAPQEDCKTVKPFPGGGQTLPSTFSAQSLKLK